MRHFPESMKKSASSENFWAKGGMRISKPRTTAVSWHVVAREHTLLMNTLPDLLTAFRVNKHVFKRIYGF